MKLHLLLRYDRLGASSRMRSLQYIQWFEAAGLSLVVSPLFSDAYVSGLQAGSRSLGEVARAYWSRLGTLMRADDSDLFWIEKELLPWLPASWEMALALNRVPYILDYDDAVYHVYDSHRSKTVRKVLGSKHTLLMQRATLVIAGNEYLASKARRSGARRVEIVPTAIDLNRYLLSPTGVGRGSATLPVIGWIGQRSTAAFFESLAPMLQRLQSSGRCLVRAIGIESEATKFGFEAVPWSEETEVESLKSFDIGIMPLSDGPFERGKCGYKLIQYMACGLPVVASPVGVNAQIVEHGVSGFLADTAADWEAYLGALIDDAQLRRTMGAVGRAKVERSYCVQVTAPRVIELLLQAVQEDARHSK